MYFDGNDLLQKEQLWIFADLSPRSLVDFPDSIFSFPTCTAFTCFIKAVSLTTNQIIKYFKFKKRSLLTAKIRLKTVLRRSSIQETMIKADSDQVLIRYQCF